MLFSRYANAEIIFRKNPEDGLEFINQMLKARQEENLYKQWLVHLPVMNKETYISFEEYVEKATGKNVDNRTTAELEHEISEIENKFREGV